MLIFVTRAFPRHVIRSMFAADWRVAGTAARTGMPRKAVKLGQSGVALVPVSFAFTSAFRGERGQGFKVDCKPPLRNDAI